MDNKEANFWIGGISSIAIYSALIFLLIFTVMNKPRKVAMISDGGMQISVEMVEPTKDITPPAVSQQQTVQTKQEEKPDEIPEIQKVVKKEPPKPQDKKERPIDTKQLMQQAIKQEPKPQEKPKEAPKQPINAKSIVSSLDLKKQTLSVSFNSSGEFDAYLNKIAQIIRAGWNPYSTDAGLVATISVNINGDGSFYFKIKNASQNNDFNLRLSEYLKSLQTKGLPPPDNGKSVSVDFNFKATQ